MNSRDIVNEMLDKHDVAWVFEDGTMDAFYALYIDGKLI